jgi:hypothetical protein
MLAFPVSESGADLGQASPAHVDLQSAGWVRTNALVFPWLQLVEKGRPFRADELARSGPFVAVHLQAGGHDLRPQWQPDRIWTALNRVSFALFACAFFITLGWALWRALARLRRPPLT